MIKQMRPLTLIEVKKFVEENNSIEGIIPYIKKYMKIKVKDVPEMKNELERLDNHKIKEEHIVKIIDLLPEDSSEVNKIFTDVGLDENEIKQITDIVSKYK